MADFWAGQSGFLSSYMSTHPDTLVAYAKWYGKVKEPITSASMVSINSENMTLSCTLELKLAFDPPLATSKDVKSRLIEMAAISKEGLGMLKSPQIDSFRFPKLRALTTSLLVCAVLPFGAFADRLSPSSLLSVPARWLYSMVTPRAWKIMLALTTGIHVIESLYMLRLCRKHRSGARTTSAYMIGTVFLGAPMWQDFSQRVQRARIDSVKSVVRLA